MTAADRAGEDFVIVGRVRNAHGIRGELVVEPITDEPGVVFAPGRRVFAGTVNGEITPDRRELHVLRATPFKEGLIVAFREINDRTAAELWTKRYVLVPSAEIHPPPEGQAFVHELLGMQVRLVSGEPVGEVVDVFELPQGLAIDVQRPGQSTTVMLLYEHSVRSLDRAARVVEVELPEGMLE